MNKGLITILMCLLFLGLRSQESALVPARDPVSLREKISDAARRTTSVRSSFTQLKHLGFLEETVTSGGEFFFRNDGRLRWEYTKPYPYVIVMSGQQIMIRDGGSINVYDAGQNPVFSGIGKVLTGIINGSLFQDKDFTASYFEKEGGYLLLLQPSDANMKAFLERIELTISPSDFGVVAVRLTELSGDFTEIRFTNKQINVPIADDIFNLH